jgi:MYXO-CTERM domain-containing protein
MDLDLNWSLMGIPAPGALGLAGLAGRRRRE